MAGAVLLLLGILGLAACAWWYVPVMYPLRLGPNDSPAVVATKQATQSQAIVTTRASVLAVVAALGAGVTIWINYRNSRINARTLATMNETFRVTERGHLTDRYTRAIEQLGNSESIAIRLGGIYALQQLAVDTTRDVDQVTVVEVLSAFVRLNLREGTAPLSGHEFSLDDEQQIQVPRADVLAAISVLAQLPDRPGARMRADFTGLSFTGLYIRDARLSGANLTDANLSGANLTDANLSGAILNQADLTGANVTGANLTDSMLNRADLTYSKLNRADLSGANLVFAKLNHANLNQADLVNTNLIFAKLNHAILNHANLTNANLTNANLTGANLTDAHLANAHLDHANLDHANLTDANLSGAHLGGAKLGTARGLVAGQLNASQRASANAVPDLEAPTTRE